MYIIRTAVAMNASFVCVNLYLELLKDTEDESEGRKNVCSMYDFINVFKMFRPKCLQLGVHSQLFLILCGKTLIARK